MVEANQDQEAIVVVVSKDQAATLVEVPSCSGAMSLMVPDLTSMEVPGPMTLVTGVGATTSYKIIPTRPTMSRSKEAISISRR